jgi:hypothetical protein
VPGAIVHARAQGLFEDARAQPVRHLSIHMARHRRVHQQHGVLGQDGQAQQAHQRSGGMAGGKCGHGAVKKRLEPCAAAVAGAHAAQDGNEQQQAGAFQHRNEQTHAHDRRPGPSRRCGQAQDAPCPRPQGIWP